MMPDIHYGKVKEEPVDWRVLSDVDDPDDEELQSTPEDVIGILGFDPLEEEVEKGGPGSGHFGHEGRPGEVGGSAPTYHGTTEMSAKKIAVEGLKPNPAVNGTGVYADRDINTAFAYAMQKMDAKKKDIWAEFKDSDRIAIVTVDKSAFNKEQLTTHSTSKTIPPNKIREIAIYKAKDVKDARMRHKYFGDKDFPKPIKFLKIPRKADEDVIYCAFGYDEDEQQGEESEKEVQILRSKDGTEPWDKEVEELGGTLVKEWRRLSKGILSDLRKELAVENKSQIDQKKVKKLLTDLRLVGKKFKGTAKDKVKKLSISIQNRAVEALEEEVQKGGEGSGHFGHEGRPGEVGGSSPGGGGEGLPRPDSSSAMSEATAMMSGFWFNSTDLAADKDLRLRDRILTDVNATRGLSNYSKEDDVKNFVSNVTAAWTGSSIAQSSLALQFAVKERFGLSEFDLEKVGVSDYYKNSAEDEYSKNKELYQSMADQVYAETQDFFASKGITEMPVYRGMAWSRQDVPDWINSMKETDVVVADQMSLSSYSADRRSAEVFARWRGEGSVGVVLEAMVPVKNIFSTGITGIGSFGEQEVVLIGKEGGTFRATRYVPE